MRQTSDDKKEIGANNSSGSKNSGPQNRAEVERLLEEIERNRTTTDS